MIEVIRGDAFGEAFTIYGNPDKRFINETRKMANELVLGLINEVANAVSEIDETQEDDEVVAEMMSLDLLECLERPDLQEQAKKLLDYDNYSKS